MTTDLPPADDVHDRLGAVLRSLADTVVRSGADAAALDALCAELERLRDDLAARPRRLRVHDSPYHPMSLVGGTAHPAAPQLHTARTGDGVAGTVTLGAAYEGGPGLAHGGVLALLLDHTMGQAVYEQGAAAMTVSLDLRYLAPTSLDVPLTVAARVERRDGRKLHVVGEVNAGGVRTVEARAVFVALTRDNVARIFAAERIAGAS